MTRSATVPAAALALLMIATPAAAWGAPPTQVIQGQVLRLVSVADWEAAADLLPGQPVQWDVEVSADAPDPGVVRIGASAVGDARLKVDATVCMQEWQGTACPDGAEQLRDDWSIPRDGAEVPLVRIADTETAHLRLVITLDPADGAGSTEVRVQAHGAGETVVVGPDGGLATTGPPPGMPWAIAAGALLALWGGHLASRSRRHPIEGARR